MRRNRPEVRVIIPDVRYNSQELSVFIHHILKNGKLSTAETIVYDALEDVQKKAGKPAMEVFDTALKNVGPMMEVRPRRVGGATYQVPIEVPNDRRVALAMRWIIDAARARSGNSFADKLSGELLDASNNTGSAVRKREETHKMAEANRAFSHYRV